MPSLLVAPRQWFSTLKFRIVLLAASTGLLSAIGTAVVVISSAQDSIERVVLTAAREDRERSAGLLASKVNVLRDALGTVAKHVPPEYWLDRDAMGRYLLDKPALGSLFSSFFAADPQGHMLARIDRGALSRELPDVADRGYFVQAMSSDQPVISEVLQGKILKTPIVVIAIPVPDRSGRNLGVLAGALSLQSAALFDELRATSSNTAVRDLVVDRSGRILAHEDPTRLMQSAQDEPGLEAEIRDWVASGSPIDTQGLAVVRGQYVVSRAGIPLTDWLHIRVVTAAVAMAPVLEARAAAVPAAVFSGLVAGLVAGAVGFAFTRPLSRLRARAESLLDETTEVSRWPDDAGEVGELSRAFRHVVEQRERRQTEVQALLQQLEAVLDHAEVGIALSRDGRFELVSRQFCLIFRCDKHDAVGEPTRMIYSSDEAFAALSSLARPALTKEGVLDTELELVRRTGQVFWARMRGRAVVPGEVSMGTIWTIEDVTAAREQREQLAYTANHDSLTGLVNRASFERLLEAATITAAHEPFFALFIDLDRFKHVNDTGGHAAGDALLRDIAQLLVLQVRRSDTVARLGGDEFAVMLPHCPGDQAQAIADKLCSAVQGYQLAWESSRFGVGASVGLVSVDGSFVTAADVMRAADSACYAAKKRGRGRVEIFRATLHEIELVDGSSTEDRRQMVRV